MDSRNELEFYKMVGSGNDFAFFLQQTSLPWGKMAKKICDRNFGIGADGLVVLEVVNEETLSWLFLNADGSSAEMCGNAARCAFSLAFQLGLVRLKSRLKTLAGEVFGEILPDKTVRVTLPMPFGVKPKPMTINKYTGMFLNTGVPHFVLPVEKIQTSSFRTTAAQIRSSKDFGAEGANVTLMESVGKNSARAITFERGVEDFTLSCGTGALAAGARLFGEGAQGEVEIEMPGGHLYVTQPTSNSLALRGQAQIVFNGKINPGVFRGLF